MKQDDIRVLANGAQYAGHGISWSEISSGKVPPDDIKMRLFRMWVKYVTAGRDTP